MRATLVVQTAEDGEKRVSFVTDPTLPLVDVLVSSGKWCDSAMLIAPVEITGPTKALETLGAHEFASVMNSDKGEDGVSLGPAAQEIISKVLGDHLTKELEQ